MDRRAEKIRGGRACGIRESGAGEEEDVWMCGWGSRAWMWVVWMEEGVDVWIGMGNGGVDACSGRGDGVDLGDMWISVDVWKREWT